MRRSSAFQMGVAIFVLVSGGVATATALSAEPPEAQLQVMLIGEPPPPTSSTTTSSTTTSTTTTTTMAPPTTSASVIARMEALGNIPGSILTAVGGNNLKVIAFSTYQDRIGGWAGGTVAHIAGGAEFSVGVHESVSTVADPVMFIARLRAGVADSFWIGVQTGVWDTPSYRQWGAYGDSSQISPDVWQGSELLDVQAPDIPGADRDFWLVVGIDGEDALYAVFDETGSNPSGTIWEMPWDPVDRWRPVVNVFEGILWMDEYYVLVP